MFHHALLLAACCALASATADIHLNLDELGRFGAAASTTTDAPDFNLGGEPEPPVCCKAMTAGCLSCAAGVSADEYCKVNPRTAGCKSTLVAPTPGGKCAKGTPDYTSTIEHCGKPFTDMACACAEGLWMCAAGMPPSCSTTPPPPPTPIRTTVATPAPVCCKALTAPCLACAKGVSVEAYCGADPRASGCPPPEPPTTVCARLRCAEGTVCVEGKGCVETPPPGCGADAGMQLEQQQQRLDGMRRAAEAIAATTADAVAGIKRADAEALDLEQLLRSLEARVASAGC